MKSTTSDCRRSISPAVFARVINEFEDVAIWSAVGLAYMQLYELVRLRLPFHEQLQFAAIFKSLARPRSPNRGENVLVNSLK